MIKCPQCGYKFVTESKTMNLPGRVPGRINPDEA
jgi:DNA-directed RNA polymerase subunit RPC12/RpoP